MYKCLFAIVLPFSLIASPYDFRGEHYIADFYDCNEEIIAHPDKVKTALQFSCLASKATIIKISESTFYPSGYTCVITLSESHASIHTYPEYNACFIDFFTCGDQADLNKFVYYMHLFLKPSIVQEMYIQRGDE